MLFFFSLSRLSQLLLETALFAKIVRAANREGTSKDTELKMEKGTKKMQNTFYESTLAE